MHFKLTKKNRMKESNGYLDLLPVGNDFYQHVCVCGGGEGGGWGLREGEREGERHSPAHNLMSEQNSAHFRILVLSLIRYGLRGGNKDRWDRFSFMWNK